MIIELTKGRFYMAISSIQQPVQSNDLVTATRQRDEMKAEEEKRSREKEEQARIQKSAELNPATKRTALPNTGRNIDVNA